MTNERITVLVITAVTVGLVLFDLGMAYAQGGATISEVIRKWSTTYPAIPFTLGVLMGHFFF